jgi:glycosyltransferase involved in cell wall biosynthesis
MKVVMVGDYPEPGGQISGGVERVIDTLLAELRHVVDLTLIVPAASRNQTCENRGVRMIYLKRARPGSLHYWTSDAVRLARIIKVLRPDIVHLQGVAGIGRLITSPCILTVHGFVDKDIVASAGSTGIGRWARKIAGHMVRVVEERAHLRIGHVICINPYVKEALPHLVDLQSYPIPNPLDPVFTTQDRNAYCLRASHIISVGRVSPLKNTLAIIAAAARIMKIDPNASLTICGAASDEGYYAKCREFIETKGLMDRIHMVGNLPSTELAALLDTASCLVMASRQENAPMAIAEAHARGVAVVAPEAFGIRHMIEPGINGLFWPMKDVTGQATVLQHALNHAWARDEIAKAARETYDVSSVASKTLAAYHAVLAGHSSLTTSHQK